MNKVIRLDNKRYHFGLLRLFCCLNEVKIRLCCLSKAEILLSTLFIPYFINKTTSVANGYDFPILKPYYLILN